LCPKSEILTQTPPNAKHKNARPKAKNHAKYAKAKFEHILDIDKPIANMLFLFTENKRRGQ